jgi:hypothetical protein
MKLKNKSILAFDFLPKPKENPENQNIVKILHNNDMIEVQTWDP